MLCSNVCFVALFITANQLQIPNKLMANGKAMASGKPIIINITLLYIVIMNTVVCIVRDQSFSKNFKETLLLMRLCHLS